MIVCMVIFDEIILTNLYPEISYYKTSQIQTCLGCFGFPITIIIQKLNYILHHFEPVEFFPTHFQAQRL